MSQENVELVTRSVDAWQRDDFDGISFADIENNSINLIAHGVISVQF